MGQPKLLLPWGNRTLIDQLLNAWTTSRVSEVVVVIRQNDGDLKHACVRWPVHIVQPAEDPHDMKESVQIGLRYLSQHFQPVDDDGCFIAPADLPGLRSEIIDRLIAETSDRSTVTVPLFGDRIGHPALLPWPLTQQVFDLPHDEGVNRLVERCRKQTVEFPAHDYFADVNTVAEYRLSLPPKDHGKARPKK